MTSLADLGIEPDTKTLVILTGPPGSQPEKWAKDRSLPAYSKLTRAMWRDHPEKEPIAMITPAPAEDAKEYWVREAHRFGWRPLVLVLEPGEYQATKQVYREHNAVNEGLKKRLAKTVKRWYASYTPHDDEIEVDG